MYTFFTLFPILTVFFLIYLITVVFFLILENRKPQSTIAWLFLFFVFPILGVFIYLFLGRGWKAFGKQDELAKKELGPDLLKILKPLISKYPKIVSRVEKEEPGSYNRKLMQLVDNNSGSILTEFNEVKILQNASEKYPQLLSDIEKAKKSVHLEYYIWSNDVFTNELKDLLIKKVKEGVKVRALYDASSAKVMGKSYRQELEQGGVEVKAYLEYTSLRNLHNAQYRSHRKIVIIDGKIGYVGGMNLDSEQLTGPKGFSHWRDTHLRIHGEAAAGLQASFAISWYNTTKENIFNKTNFPLDEIKKEVTHFLPVQIAQSGPDSQFNGLRQLYFFLIMAATKSIQIQSPFFIPDESILEALKSSALAGVDVKMIIQPRGGTFQVPYRAAYTYYSELAEAGVKIFLYQNKTYFHPKTINIDSSICSVGSANWDIRSFNINYEINGVVYDKGIAQELSNDFENDLKYCSQFNLKKYQQDPIIRKFADSCYRLVSSLM